MKITFIKVEPCVTEKNRKFYKHARRAFIEWCAYKGLLNFLTKQELRQAKKGILPDDLNVHHKLPVSGTYSDRVNDFQNLVVIHRNTHININKKIYDPIISKLDYGDIAIFDVPDYNFVDKEGILYERHSRVLNILNKEL